MRRLQSSKKVWLSSFSRLNAVELELTPTSTPAWCSGGLAALACILNFSCGVAGAHCIHAEEVSAEAREISADAKVHCDIPYAEKHVGPVPKFALYLWRVIWLSSLY